MKLDKIQSAYIKNKPSYNYEIKDEDGILVAKGHLLSERQRNEIDKYLQFDVNDEGFPTLKALPSLQYYATLIIKSLDWWIIQEPITIETIDYLQKTIILWLVDQITAKNLQAITSVEINSKN